MKNKILWAIGILILIIILVVTVFIIKRENNKKKINRDEYTQVYFYDLGKSNVSVIKKNNHVILINTGLEEERDNLLDELDKLGIQKIDYLILTNRDDKYIGNASFILNGYQVDYLYLNDFNYTSKKVEELDNTLMDNYVDSITLTSDENIVLDDLNIDIYTYMDDEYTMKDKTFIVRVSEGEKAIYFINDVSSMRYSEVTNSNLLISENKDLYDINSEYYLYTGTGEIKDRPDLLDNKIKDVLINKKELIIE